jgi:predicted AAA+ superfamily ATPase
LPPFVRPQAARLAARLREPRRFVQVLAGPRQVGKTTLVRQVLADYPAPWRYASADEPALRGSEWIGQQWDAARLDARRGSDAVLVLDEVQKVPGWAEAVKRRWDEDAATGAPLKVVILGSSPLLMQRGLTESLAGRFEVLPLGHWGYAEMREAFGWSLEQFVCFGGYPGAAPLASDFDRWGHYVRESLVETTVSRDILLLTRVDKPALLRRLFELSCRYSGQVLSFQKMVGQLQDAGNTTTLAHYLDLLSAAGMVTGIQKFAGEAVRSRASSPKLLALNTGLITAHLGLGPEALRGDPTRWGRLVESAVGAHLAGAAAAGDCELFYWLDRNREVDFVARVGDAVTAIEVKSGASRETLPGMAAFAAAFRPHRTLLVGSGGIPLEEFLAAPPLHWVAR